MKKRDVLIGLFAIALLVGNFWLIAEQQAKIHQYESELGDVIPLGGELDWGATFYFYHYRNGVLIGEDSHSNVITNAARSALRGHIGDTTVNVWNYIAIGTGSGGGVGSTTLVTEFSRYQGAYATVGSYNFTIDFTWTAGNFSGQTITEYGVLNAAAAGTLLNYDDSISRGPLLAADSLQVTVNFQIGS